MGLCLAELVASQKINENPEKKVFGIVTDGNLWLYCFLKENLFVKNSDNFTIDKIKTLYGALESIVNSIE